MMQYLTVVLNLKQLFILPVNQARIDQNQFLLASSFSFGHQDKTEGQKCFRKDLQGEILVQSVWTGNLQVLSVSFKELRKIHTHEESKRQKKISRAKQRLIFRYTTKRSSGELNEFEKSRAWIFFYGFQKKEEQLLRGKTQVVLYYFY